MTTLGRRLIAAKSEEQAASHKNKNKNIIQILFDAILAPAKSQNITVGNTAYVVIAFGLSDGEVIQINNVFQGIESPLNYAGEPILLTNDNNVVVLPLSGIFNCELLTATVERITLIAYPVSVANKTKNANLDNPNGAHNRNYNIGFDGSAGLEYSHVFQVGSVPAIFRAYGLTDQVIELEAVYEDISSPVYEDGEQKVLTEDNNSLLVVPAGLYRFKLIGDSTGVRLVQNNTEINVGEPFIKQGPPGAQGEPGVPGIQGEKGDPGNDGADGADGADGTNGTNGTNGADGADGANGADGVVQSVVAGTNVTVDDTDPANPVINATGGGGAGDFASITGDPTDNAALVAWGATLAGAVVTYNSYLSTAADSTALGIPVDGSIPQISEGKALGSVTITPKYASSIIELELSIGLSSCSASSHSSFFAFKDADADTIGGGVTYFAAGLGRPINVRIIVPASSTAARTYSWRYGSQGGTGATQYINSLGGTQTHGATTQVYITAKEIKQ